MPFSMDDFLLKGKVAIVTGSGRGIGRAMALGLANAGADVALASRTVSELEEVAAAVRRLGVRALPVPTDMSNLSDVRALASKVHAELGRIDVLVNNAAINPSLDNALDFTDDCWDAIMSVNLKGPFFLSQAVARIMKEQGGGSIINTGSVVGIHPDLIPVYAISKGGLMHATKVMAREWAQYNIRVNCVIPGLTNTRLASGLFESPELLAHITEAIPLRRTGVPDDMAGAVVYLASNAASYVTGHILAVEGGALL